MIRSFSRRQFLAGAGGAGAAALLAACGSKSAGNSATGNGATGSTATTAATGATAAGGSGGVSAAVLSQLRDILNPAQGKAAGQGLNVKVGGSFGFSGGAEGFSNSMIPGVQLVVAHIEALGGPKLAFETSNSGLADASLGVALARQFGSSGYPLMFTSLGADGGSELPFFKQYKMLGIDGGATSTDYEGLPFFYQTRMFFPNDTVTGLCMYWKTARPDIKRITFALQETASPKATNAEIGIAQNLIQQHGYTFAGSVGASTTQTDYTPQILQITNQKPDAVISLIDGEAQQVWTTQWARSGLKNKIALGLFDTEKASEVTPAIANGLYFCFDYFNTANPGNQWGSLFASEYLRAYGAWRDYPYLTANYYEDTFLLWELIQRVIAAGGDPATQGDQWTTAFEQKTTFPSVYGIGGSSGTMSFGATTNTIDRKFLAVGQYTGLTPEVKAVLYTGGQGFKLV